MGTAPSYPAGFAVLTSSGGDLKSDCFSSRRLLGRDRDETFWSNFSICEFVDRDTVLRSRSHGCVEMLAIGRKPESDKVTLPGRFFVATQAIVREIAQLIVAEIKNRDRLSHPALFSAVSLVEQSCLTTIATQRNGRRIAIGASNEAGEWNSKRFARRKTNLTRARLRVQ